MTATLHPLHTTLAEAEEQMHAQVAAAKTAMDTYLARLEAERRAFLEEAAAAAAAHARLWGDYDPELLQQFFDEPYVVRPLGDGQYELIVPRFLPLRAGWPLRQTASYTIFQVSKFLHFLSPAPEWLAEQLGFGAPSFQAVLDGLDLTITDGDAATVYRQLGGHATIARRVGQRLTLRPASRFHVIRKIIREEGFLPYAPAPVPIELQREPAIAHDEAGRPALALRPHQNKSYQQFLELGAVSVYAAPQQGKSYLGAFACAALRGPKLILVPRKALADQWRARLELYLTPDAARDVVVATYQSAHKYLDREWTLVIYDEAHHVPADFAIEAATGLKARSRIGLSSTPMREDGNAEIIPALTGFPIGMDWPVRPHQKPNVTVWLLKNEAHKVAHVRKLAAERVDGKTIIFTQRLAIGQEVADALGVPMVHHKTKQPRETIAAHPTVVLSPIGDEGLTIEGIRRVIELEGLFGSRMQSGQRAGRLFTSEAEQAGEHHITMTFEEFHKYNKRLLIYEQWGLRLQIKTPEGGLTTKPLQLGKVAPARPAHAPRIRVQRTSTMPDRWSEIERIPALAKRKEQALLGQEVRIANLIPRVFNVLQQPLSPKDLAEGWGMLSLKSQQRIRLACMALAQADLVIALEDGRYQRNEAEIARLMGVTEQVLGPAPVATM